MRELHTKMTDLDDEGAKGILPADEAGIEQSTKRAKSDGDGSSNEQSDKIPKNPSSSE